MFKDPAKKLGESLICGKTASWPRLEVELLQSRGGSSKALAWVALNQPSQPWQSNFQDQSQFNQILSKSNSSKRNV